MKIYEAVIKVDEAQHIVTFSGRDYKVLRGPFIENGDEILSLLGFFNEGEIVVSTDVLFRALQKFFVFLTTNSELLEYDYQYSFSGNETQCMGKGSGGFCGFSIQGKRWCIFAEPGHCYLCEAGNDEQGICRWVNHVDLRQSSPAQTDDWGVLKIHKRKRLLCWPTEVMALLDFLKQNESENATVYNPYG